MAKHLPAMQETQVQSLGREDPLEKGMAIHSSIYPCLENPTEREAWWATVHGSQRVGHNRATKTTTTTKNNNSTLQGHSHMHAILFDIIQVFILFL